MTAAGGRVLVINAGSSSVKCGLYAAADGAAGALVRVRCDVRPAGRRLEIRSATTVGEQVLPAAADPVEAAVAAVLDRAVASGGGPVIAVGHRIVHGGLEFSGPVIVDEEVLAKLGALEPLAPLHQPHGVAAIRRAAALLPAAVQVACFDTAFHRTCPPVATRFAIPRRWHEAGIRRYGFHGLSYESVVARLPAVAGPLPGRLIVAHLGAGASLCAVRDGRSVATTMGFTPLDGLVMATRCGTIDPGAVLQLILRGGLRAAEVERMLTHESGLLGVSGISGDMRELLASADPRAVEAVELFCDRAAREMAALAVSLGGLEAVVFTAGIGEHAADVRRRICDRLGWLGLALDTAANQRHGPRISAGSSRVAAWVVPTDEEATIAAHVGRLVGSNAAGPRPATT